MRVCHQLTLPEAARDPKCHRWSVEVRLVDILAGVSFQQYIQLRPTGPLALISKPRIGSVHVGLSCSRSASAVCHDDDGKTDLSIRLNSTPRIRSFNPLTLYRE